MAKKMKKIGAFLLALVMCVSMLPTSAFALDLTSEDVTPGEGWVWEEDTKTLTLNGAAITETVTLPDGATIVVNGDCSIDAGTANAIVSAGALTISGAGKLTLAGDYGIKAASVSISNIDVDIEATSYGIDVRNGAGDSVVVLKNVDGSIEGGLAGILVWAATANSEASVSVDACDLTLMSKKAGGFGGNTQYSGIAVTAEGLVNVECSIDIKDSVVNANGRDAGISVNNYVGVDNGASAIINIANSTVSACGRNNIWAGIFASTSGRVAGADAIITITDSSVYAASASLGMMTSAYAGRSEMLLDNSILGASGATAALSIRQSTTPADAKAELKNGSTYIKLVGNMTVEGAASIASGKTIIATAGDGITYDAENNYFVIPQGSVVTENFTDGTSKEYTFNGQAGGIGGFNYAKEEIWGYDVPYTATCKIVETGVEYDTLTEAVSAANKMDSATIEMLKSIDFEGTKLEIKKDITIIGKYTISRGAYTGTLFTVPAGSSLTLDGGIVFDGSNNWIFDKALYENDLYNRVDNPITAYAYSAEGGTVGTAAAFVVNGTVTANDATFQNFFSTKDSNAGDAAIFKVNANAVLDTNGALINHCATYGANTVAHLATNAKWYIQGDTMISNNFGGRNGGMCRNDSGQIYMSGGTVKDNAGKNVNGTFVMMYGTGSAFYMTGGTISHNSSVFGINNGRCAAVYLHANSYMKMTGGTISHNIGGSRGGIDSYKSSSVLDINRVDQTFVDGVYPGENGKDAYTASNHPMIVDNVSLIGHDSHDVGHSFNFDTWWVTGGIYTQDVDEFCAEGYICIPYTDTAREDDYIVVPGYRVKYYSVEKVETEKDVLDESGAVVGTEPVVELQTTLVYKYFHMLPRDKFWYEMDERANYFELTNDEGSTISTWYTEKELANIYDFDTELKSDLNLYGEWEAPYVPVHTLGSIVVNKTTTGAATPADAAFQLQKLNGESWINVGEAVPFSAFVNNAYTFTGLGEGTYRVIESGAEIEAFRLETTYGENVVLTRTTADNGDSAVNSGSILVTNTYDPFVHTPGTITVNKIATGAATPAGATFQLQKLNGETWTNVGEAVAFSQFVDGAYTFTGLEEGTYRIVESGAEVEGYTLETTYSANVVLTKTTADNGDTAVDSNKISVTNAYAIEEKPTEPEETEPEDNIEIPDEDVPLADVPKTGDLILPFLGMAIASGAATIFVGKTDKKKEDEE